MSIARLVLLVLVSALAVVVYLHQSMMVNHLEEHPVLLKGKTAIVTGGTDGIGKATARTLAKWGARVILPVRDENKGNRVLKELQADIADFAAINGGSVEIIPGVDFMRLETVRELAKKLTGTQIDILINNAGMMHDAQEATVDGVEKVYQVNQLAPFLLTRLLVPNLSANSRVVFVSSSMHALSTGVAVDSKYGTQARGMGKDTADGMARYSDSKLMNLLTAQAFHERFGNLGITFTSVHPGYVISSLDRNLPSPMYEMAVFVRKSIARPTQQGAVTQITAATHPRLNKQAGGKYLSDHCINQLCQGECWWCESKTAPGVVPSALAQDKRARDWLWQVSSELVGLPVQA